MIAYRGKRFYVKREGVRLPGGTLLNDVETVVRRHGTWIIPMLDEKTLLIGYQYRPQVRKWVYNLVGGSVEKGESPKANALKEIREEAGYAAKRMVQIGKFYIAPYTGPETEYAFVATGLSRTNRALEKGELINIQRMTLQNAIRMACSGKIDDAGSVAALLIYWYNLGKARRPV